MLDLTDQLHRYAEAVGGVVPERNVPDTRQGAPKRLLAAAAVAVLLLAAGLAAVANMAEDDSPVATQPATHGTLAGTLQLVGGRYGADPVPVPGTVEVQRLDSEEALTVATTSDGGFRLELPPGEYQLLGRSPQYNAGGEPCRAFETVKVRAGETSEAIVGCSMK